MTAIRPDFDRYKAKMTRDISVVILERASLQYFDNEEAEATDRDNGQDIPGSLAEADLLRAIERARLRALVTKDVKTAEQLHSDDFQLIRPGEALTRKLSTLARSRSASSITSYGSPTNRSRCGSMATAR
jgi:hypothetical protein